MFYSKDGEDVAYELVSTKLVQYDANTTASYVSMVTAGFYGYVPDVGCGGRWGSVNHLLFHLANSALLAGYLFPTKAYGVLFMHIFLILGFLLFSVWAWIVLCAPDVFSWNFSFMLINAVQMLFVLYRLRPLKFTSELDDVYAALFQPLRVPRELFKKMINSEYASVMTLHKGEAYATQDITKTDKLAILITGRAHVMCNGQFLHYIHEKQFFDSPEFESTTNGDEKFQVSIIASTTCHYIVWQRTSLEYLFVKDHYLSNVMGIIIGRDITNKLYALNDKVRVAKGNYIDIRLPGMSSTLNNTNQNSINRFANGDKNKDYSELPKDGVGRQGQGHSNVAREHDEGQFPWHDGKVFKDGGRFDLGLRWSEDEDIDTKDRARRHKTANNCHGIVGNGHELKRPLVPTNKTSVVHNVNSYSRNVKERRV